MPNLNDTFENKSAALDVDHNRKGEGRYARCYRVQRAEDKQCFAFKFLRHTLDEDIGKPIDPTRADFESFVREVEMLSKLYPLTTKKHREPMARVPQLWGQGYFRNQSSDDWSEIRQCLHEQLDQQHFANEYEARMLDGWRPYLLLEPLPKDRSVANICRFYRNLFKNDQSVLPHMPLFEALEFSLQIARLFKLIHSLTPKILYPDSKLLHYFWNGSQAILIDWNVTFKEGEHYENKAPNVKEDIFMFAATAMFGVMTTSKHAEHPQPYREGSYTDPRQVSELLGDLHYPNAPAVQDLLQNFFNELLVQKSIGTAARLEERILQLKEDLYQDVPDDYMSMYQEISNKLNAIHNQMDDLFRQTQLLRTKTDWDYYTRLIGIVRQNRTVPWQPSDSTCPSDF